MTNQEKIEKMVSMQEIGSDMEITYSEPSFSAPNRALQEMSANGEAVGMLSTYSNNIFDTIHETWYLPDVERGLIDDKWVEFKSFIDYEVMQDYLKKNFTEIVNLYKNGDWD